jgi:hypothetical protein
LSIGGISSFSMTTAPITPRMGARVRSAAVVRGAFHQRARSQDVSRRITKPASRSQQRRIRIGLWRAAARSRVGRIRKESGATAAAKKIGAPRAAASASRCRMRTGAASLSGALNSAGPRSRFPDVFRDDGGREPGRVRPVEEELDRPPPLRAVAAGPPVDVHADEAVRLPPLEAARIAHRVRERLLPVGQAVFDRAGQGPRDPRDPLRAEIAPHDVAAERQRKAGLGLPPPAQVLDLRETLLRERELPLVDQDSRVEAPREHAFEDLVETAELGRDPGSPERQGEMRGRATSGRRDSDLPRSDRLRERGRRATTTGPYPSPKEAPCGRSRYRSARKA